MATLVSRDWTSISRKLLGALAGVLAGGTAGSFAGADQLVLWFWSVGKAIFPALPDMPEAVASWIGAMLSSGLGAFVGGWLPKETLPPGATLEPNNTASPIVLKSHPVATGVAFVIAFSFLAGILGGCAPAAVPGDPTQPPAGSTVSANIVYAEGFVKTAEAAADTCVALKLPLCSSATFVAGLQKARTIADAAIVEAKGYPINGTTEDKINAALRVAMNAVLLFYSLKAS